MEAYREEIAGCIGCKCNGAEGVGGGGGTPMCHTCPRYKAKLKGPTALDGWDGGTPIKWQSPGPRLIVQTEQKPGKTGTVD